MSTIIGGNREFFDAFREESDRACAVLARALLEDLLKRLFEAVFVADQPSNVQKDLLGGQGPLATFSARTHLAESLGFITHREARDLALIRKVGNDFAHSLDHEMTFDSPSVRDRVFTLSFAAAFVEHAKAGDGPEEVKSDELESIKTVPRRRFEIGVAMLWLFLDHRIRQTEPASEPQTLAIGF